jgi:acyl-CoA reductase-like NAD-dependent aldehyde dehydrogenase
MPSTMIEVCNPATCELLATVPDCDAAEVDRAVAVARASFQNKTWRGLDPSKRERILWKIGDLLL